MPAANRYGIVVLPPAGNAWPEKFGVHNSGKNRRRPPRLTQKRALNMKLKGDQWTRAVRKDRLQMFHGLH
jgi:hypothetical protein